MDASIVIRKDDRIEITSCQETTEACLECGETASGDIKDAGIKSTACHEATERDSEETEPNTEMMQSTVEHE
jgi:hypothetical protein